MTICERLAAAIVGLAIAGPALAQPFGSGMSKHDLVYVAHGQTVPPGALVVAGEDILASAGSPAQRAGQVSGSSDAKRCAPSQPTAATTPEAKPAAQGASFKDLWRKAKEQVNAQVGRAPASAADTGGLLGELLKAQRTAAGAAAPDCSDATAPAQGGATGSGGERDIWAERESLFTNAALYVTGTKKDHPDAVIVARASTTPVYVVSRTGVFGSRVMDLKAVQATLQGAQGGTPSGSAVIQTRQPLAGSSDAAGRTGSDIAVDLTQLQLSPAAQEAYSVLMGEFVGADGRKLPSFNRDSRVSKAAVQTVDALSARDRAEVLAAASFEIIFTHGLGVETALEKV